MAQDPFISHLDDMFFNGPRPAHGRLGGTGAGLKLLHFFLNMGVEVVISARKKRVCENEMKWF